MRDVWQVANWVRRELISIQIQLANQAFLRDCNRLAALLDHLVERRVRSPEQQPKQRLPYIAHVVLVEGLEQHIHCARITLDSSNIISKLLANRLSQLILQRRINFRRIMNSRDFCCAIAGCADYLLYLWIPRIAAVRQQRIYDIRKRLVRRPRCIQPNLI